MLKVHSSLLILVQLVCMWVNYPHRSPSNLFCRVSCWSFPLRHQITVSILCFVSTNQLINSSARIGCIIVEICVGSCLYTVWVLVFLVNLYWEEWQLDYISDINSTLCIQCKSCTRLLWSYIRVICVPLVWPLPNKYFLSLLIGDILSRIRSSP